MSNLHTKAMLVSLTVRQWSARKLDRQATNDIHSANGADSTAGRYNKLLVDKSAIQRVAKIAGKIRTEHYKLTLPWADDGARILPANMFAEYTAVMRKLSAEFNNAADTFTNEYELLRDERKYSLGNLWRETDYPSSDSIRAKFATSFHVLPLPDASDFRVDISNDEISQIKSDIEQTVANSMQGACQDIWQRLLDTVSHMANKLNNSEAIFRDSLIGNLQDLVNLIPKLNFTGDKQITAMVEKIKVMLLTDKIKPDTLRKDPHLRQTTAETASKIASEMEAFMS